jgi:RNA polymerase sigma-70 factor (ECF subfamily)
LEDKLTIKKFKEGDAAAFDALYHQYSKKIYNFSYGLLKDRDTANEILQEVFVHLWQKRDQIDIALSFENYIFTIAYNSVRKYYRRKSIENKVRCYLSDHSSDISENTDRDIIYNELLELAYREIEKLPHKQKVVYKLSRQEGMKIKQIASLLNISPRTVENHLSKALKFLKEELSEISALHPS